MRTRGCWMWCEAQVYHLCHLASKIHHTSVHRSIKVFYREKLSFLIQVKDPDSFRPLNIPQIEIPFRDMASFVAEADASITERSVFVLCRWSLAKLPYFYASRHDFVTTEIMVTTKSGHENCTSQKWPRTNYYIQSAHQLTRPNVWLQKILLLGIKMV